MGYVSCVLRYRRYRKGLSFPKQSFQSCKTCTKPRMLNAYQLVSKMLLFTLVKGHNIWMIFKGIERVWFCLVLDMQCFELVALHCSSTWQSGIPRVTLNGQHQAQRAILYIYMYMKQNHSMSQTTDEHTDCVKEMMNISLMHKHLNAQSNSASLSSRIRNKPDPEMRNATGTGSAKLYRKRKYKMLPEVEITLAYTNAIIRQSTNRHDVNILRMIVTGERYLSTWGLGGGWAGKG